MESDRSWAFAASADQVWAALADTQRFGSWWPWLRRFDAADGLAVGAEWRCVIKPPLPYTVSFRLSIDDVRSPEHVVATVCGDLSGHARIDVTPQGGEACTLRLRSTLRPIRRPLVALGIVAGPLARWGHDWVLDTGVRQFAGAVSEAGGLRPS